jgi:PKD repeat protein
LEKKKITIILVLLIFISIIPNINGIETHEIGPIVIYGYAQLLTGEKPVGALVEVYSYYGSVNTTTTLDGYWILHPGWGVGTDIIVNITYESNWSGSKSGKIENKASNFFGIIILYPLYLYPVAEYDEGDYLPEDSIKFHGNVYGGDPPYIFNWDFGDNKYSTLQHPYHIYKDPGFYNVTFKVEDSSDEIATDNLQIYINPLLVYIEYQEQRYTTVDSIQFNGFVEAGKPPFRWYWDFGDGEYSNEHSPSHIYSEFGNYTINLTVTDLNGDSDTDNLLIYIHPEFKSTTEGLIHNVTFYYDYEENFPLGFVYLSGDFFGIMIAPIYYASINYSIGEKIATHTVYDGNMIVFSNDYYEEFTITISPFLGFYGKQHYKRFIGKVDAYGS